MSSDNRLILRVEHPDHRPWELDGYYTERLERMYVAMAKGLIDAGFSTKVFREVPAREEVDLNS